MKRYLPLYTIEEKDKFIYSFMKNRVIGNCPKDISNYLFDIINELTLEGFEMCLHFNKISGYWECDFYNIDYPAHGLSSADKMRIAILDASINAIRKYKSRRRKLSK